MILILCAQLCRKKTLKSLLKKIQEHGRKYEWIQIAENYGRAVDFVRDKHSMQAAELFEKMGFSFYKAAMQAPNNAEFKRRINLAIEAYEKEFRLLEGMGKENSHVLALIAYVRSCLETIPLKRKKLLGKWWKFEKQAKEEFEDIGDLRSVAIICNNLVECSSYDWFWSSSSFSETKNI